MSWCQWRTIACARGLQRAGRGVLAAVILFCPASLARAQEAQSEESKRTIRAVRINPETPKVDGVLDDPIWQRVEFVGAFDQKNPNEGEPALNQTEVGICYDDEAIYVAARMKSVNPDNILATISRRDNVSNSERILVSFDTYHNRRTAYTFGVTASGVRVDYYHGSDYESSRDYDWDPVWRAKTKRTPEGWTAEMRIPLSQLRFQKKDVQVWGMNVNRWVPTGNEDSYWVMVPKNETGWASRMGEVHGIQGLRPPQRIELMPYAASEGTFISGIDAEDPFHTPEEYETRFGGDVKVGVGPNLTLEGTINPDFGQVEADPAEVNLTAFETFFAERRPFFVEGKNLLQGGGAGYFYSRRIGAPPHGSPDADYTDVPNNTPIIGAAKLTGRTNAGLNVGVLGAVTARETGKYFNEGDTSVGSEEVEPLTGFGTVRLQQEFGKGGSTGGFILTGVQRDFGDGSPLVDDLRERAFAGGTDWNLRFQGGKYQMGFNVGFSRVEGSARAIEQTQTSSARYFQRPDNDYVDFDTTRTSMTGWTSDVWFEKTSGEHWLWDIGAGAESPEFEINDAGQLGTADDIDSWGGLRYRDNTPGLFQSWWTQLRFGSGWNFGGDRQYTYLDYEAVLEFRNFMGTFFGVEHYFPSQNDNLTRGGPSMGSGPTIALWHEWWSSSQKRTTWGLWGGYSNDYQEDGWSYWLGGQTAFRPLDRLQFSINPNYNHRDYPRQYIMEEVGGSAATYGTRYVFSHIERSQLALQARLNLALTPDFTIELYAEPFAASGRYHDFGEMKAARDQNLRFYGTDGTSITNNGDGTYTVTDGAQTFDIDQPDFNFVSFRSNLVVRWEWSPGSTLFFVWQMNRSGENDSGDLVTGKSLLDGLQAGGDNFFAVKLTYWIPFL